MPLIAQLTDLHIREGGALAYGRVDTLAFLNAAVDHLNAFVPRLAGVVVSGDVVDVGTPGEYRVARSVLDRLGMPWWPVPGNHDGSAFYEAFADRTENPAYGIGHVVRLGDLRFVMLDTRVEGAPHGHFGDDRAAWLADALAEPTALLVMHHPPFPTGIAHMDRLGLQGCERFAQVVAAAPPRAILCGHIHRTIITSLAGVPVVVAPSPAHAVSLDLRKDGPSTFHMEPPGVMVHKIDAERIVSHVSFIGDYAGPHPFFGDDAGS
ncbi:MAG: metallophosphoesterase [Pseudomonadota bacterium]